MNDIAYIEKKELEKLVGGLSQPSKMPGYGYSLPAKDCITGSKLVNVEGSVCSSCYALKGHYRYPVVVNALERRLKAVTEDFMWPFNMIALLRKKIPKGGVFRWHDSGDLQSLEHLGQICYIAKQTPDIKYWMPTREHKFVKQYLDINGEFPPNLCVRISGHMVNVSKDIERYPNSSTVITEEKFAYGKNICPATIKSNPSECGECRACWDTSVKNVNYIKH